MSEQLHIPQGHERGEAMTGVQRAISLSTSLFKAAKSFVLPFLWYSSGFFAFNASTAPVSFSN